MKVYRTSLFVIACTLISSMAVVEPAQAQQANTIKSEHTAKATSPKAEMVVMPKITAPKEQEAAKMEALAFLKRVEAAIQSKSYERVAALISKNFVTFKPGEPISKEAVQFIDGLLCGMIPPINWRSKPHCVQLKDVEAFTLQELDFYDVGAWQLRYSMTGPADKGSKSQTVSIDLSLTKEEVTGEGKVLRLMGPAG